MSTATIVFASRCHQSRDESRDRKEQLAQHKFIYFNIIKSKMRNFNCLNSNSIKEFGSNNQVNLVNFNFIKGLLSQIVEF